VPSGRQWANVLHARYAGGASTPGSTEVSALDAKLARFWTGTAYTSGTAWLGQCHSNVTLIDITYYILNGVAPPIVINHAAAGVITTGTSLPSEVAHVMTVRTLVRGRRNRGRIYLPCANSSAIDAAGNLTSAIAVSTLAQWNGLVADLVANNWELGVASYGTSWNLNPTDHHLAKIHSTWTPYFTPYSTNSMDLKPDVQRRRK